MKKFLLISFLFFSTLCLGGITTRAQTPTTQDVFGTGDIGLSTDTTGLIDYTDTDSTDASFRKNLSGNDGALYFSNIVSNVIRYLKKILVPISILFIVWAGTTLILSAGEEEEFDRRKRMVYAAFFGWMILLTAVVLVDNVFFGTTGDIFRETTNTTVETLAQRGVTELQGLFKYLITFAVAVGVAFIVFSALKLILAGGEDEAQISNIKKRIVYTAGGMVLLVSAEKLVSFFSTKVRSGSDVMMLSTPNIPDTIRFIVDWGNFMLGLIGTISVLMLVWGGVRLIANFGVDEQAIDNAKKTLMAAALGLILAFSAWSLMWFFLVH